MRRYFLFVMILVLCGCQVLDPPDVRATLQAESQTIVEEATAIAGAAQRDEARVMATAQAAASQVAAVQLENQVLWATVRAGDPQTGVVVNTYSTPVGLESGRRWFVKTGTSTRVREADGCVEDARIRFPAGIQRIYATLHAYNVEAGLPISVAWLYEGAEVWTERWTTPRDYPDICIWFYIDSDIVELRPGKWSARLFADGFQLEDAMSFVIEDSTMGSGG